MTNWGGEAPVAATETWLTPPDLVAALGRFDLDPCSAPDMPWKIADNVYTEEDDGLIQPWAGRVFMNPPYGNKLGLFLKRLAEHGDGVALVFARTETRAFFDYVWPHADAIMFLKGRVRFYRSDGSRGASSGSPSVLLAYGANNVEALRLSGLDGIVFDIKKEGGGKL